LDSVYITRRDMCDQCVITNKLGSNCLWILPSKDFLLLLLKKICDKYEKSLDAKKLLPAKVCGLQPNSVPPVWVLNKHTHLTLTDGDIRYLSADQSYVLNGDGFPSYTYSDMMKGMLDQGQMLKSLIQQLVSFIDDDINVALLVVGGTVMSFHYDLLHSLIGGVPITMAIGDPVSGKSTTVEAMLALFDERESVGAGTGAKLLETLVDRTIPIWWDDIDNPPVLENLTVLVFNKSKQVTLGCERVGSTLPIISINQTKLWGGFLRLKWKAEGFNRTIPLPFRMKASNVSLSERLDSRSVMGRLLKELPRSISVIKLHNDFTNMSKDKLFATIEEILVIYNLPDPRSQMNIA
ncbi:Hypothetical predicted protein, partial [Paramuricea clavata]